VVIATEDGTPATLVDHPESVPASLEFRILGPVDVVRNGVVIALDGSKQCTVLAALLLADGRVLSDSRLSYLLWGDSPPTTVHAQIYTYVSRLRKYLGPQVDICRRPPGYTMDIGALRFDLLEFEQLTRLGRETLGHGHYQNAAELLHSALACWRGPALANVSEFLAASDVYRLEEARMVTLECRIEADLALGRHSQVVSELTGLVTEHPLREQLRAKLMVALYRLDRQSDALATYRDARRILADEIGADPGVTLSEAYQAVLHGGPEIRYPAGARAPDHPRRQPAHPPDWLPPDLPDFSGRDGEFERLRSILVAQQPESTQPSVVPVVSGMAGVGKTALALRAVYALRPPFPDGQLYADLGGSSARPSDPADVLGWFLRAINGAGSFLPAGCDERAQLYRSRLASRRMLVLLDDAVNDEQVRPLLPAAAGCRVIITSRNRLEALAGSALIDLEALEPEAALALFTRIVGGDRADAEPGAAKHIVDLCGRLPLGLRIAGARLAARPHWQLSRLADRLDDDGRRLNELSLGTMNVRESIRMSYDRLSERARTTLQRLSLLNVADFPAWTVAVLLGSSSADGEEIAESLVDLHLLEMGQPDHRGRPRYRFHDLVRLFAREAAAEQQRDRGGQDPL
jgi:DNA-binding SARP family transcriptional activator